MVVFSRVIFLMFTNSNFFQYNVSLIGNYIVILPAIKISHIVPGEVAVSNIVEIYNCYRNIFFLL